MWTADCHLELLPFVINFNAEDEASLYPQSFFTQQVVYKLDPVSWLMSLKRFSKTSMIQNLADVMIHLLCCHAQPVRLTVEQVFSSFGLIYTKLRNWLGVDRAAKLVFCYSMPSYAVQLLSRTLLTSIA